MRLQNRSFVKTLFLTLFSIALGGGLLWAFATNIYPGIARDMIIAKDPEPFIGDVSNGECTVKLVFSVYCTADVSWTTQAGARITQNVTASFIDVKSGGYSVETVRSASHPDLVSLDIAVAKIWNRIAAAALCVIVGLFFLILAPLGVIRGPAERKRIQALSEVIQRPVAVKIHKQATNGGLTAVTYLWNDGAKERKLHAFMTGGQTPLLLEPGSKQGLALVANGQDFAFLVDDDFQRLVLNDAERAALIRARDEA